MKKDRNQKLIDEITELSSNDDSILSQKINSLIDIYHKQKKDNEQLKRENNFFLKKWNKRNILDHDKKDKIIEQQSRLAAMGEMMDAVAHQWKQPLNAVSMVVDILEDDFKAGDVNNDYVKDLGETVHLQIDHMVNTLNAFRNFLRPSTKNEEFYINSIIENVELLMKDELIAQNLFIRLNIDYNLKIFGNTNEFKHLFINLINNSIDAFNEKSVNTREMDIRCYSKDKKIYIELEDNAGGIPNSIINNIFKPNITTKAEDKGTGIGLYMSQQIIKKYNGTINVVNTQDGALFTISLPESSI